MTVCKAIRRGSRRRVPHRASFWLAVGLAAAVSSGGDPCAVAQGGATATAAQSPQLEPQPLRLTDVELPQGFVGLPFYTSVAATGGSGRYSVLVSGELPPGMRFARGGGVVAVGGVPAAEGTYEFTVAVTDIAQGGSVSHTYSIRVDPQLLHPDATNPRAMVTDTETFHFTDTDSVFFPVTIADSEGFHFTDAYRVYMPVLVTDLESFHYTDAASFSGPDQPGHPESFHFGDSYSVMTSAVITDLEGFHFTDAASFSGADQPGHPENFHFGDSYSVMTSAVINDLESFHFTDAASFSGGADQPSHPEAFHFGDSYIVTTSGLPTDPENFHFGDSYTVTPGIGISPATAPAGTYNTAYSQTFTAVGNTGAVTLTPLGTLPTGMGFSGTGSSRTLSGTPTQTGTFSFSIKAQDTVNTTTVNYSLVINPASQSITVGTIPSVTYGATNFGLSATASPSGLPVTITSTSTLVTGTGPFVPVGAGNATFTATQAGNANYSAATPVNFSVPIAQAPLGVKAANASRAFDQPNPSFGYSFGSFMNGDTASVVSGAPIIATTATPLSPIGGNPYTVNIFQGTLSAANYTFNFVNGSLTVIKAPQSIAFYPLPTLSNGSTFPLTARASSGLAVSYSVTGGNITNNILTVTASSGSLVTVTASQSGNGNYNAATSVVRSFTAP